VITKIIYVITRLHKFLNIGGKMNEIKKELEKKLSSKQKAKLFFVDNFNKTIALRRVQKFGG
jgi:hypothetical protein